MSMHRSLLRRLQSKRDPTRRVDARTGTPARCGPAPMPRMRWPS